MRKDGRRVKDADAMYILIPYLLKHRYDAMNMISVNIPYDPLHRYLSQKRKEGLRMSYMGLIISAYLRVAAEFPKLNRFIVNKRIYARNEFTVAMVVLKPGVDETMAKLRLELTDTVFDVHEKLNNFIDTNRMQQSRNATDKIM